MVDGPGLGSSLATRLDIKLATRLDIKLATRLKTILLHSRNILPSRLHPRLLPRMCKTKDYPFTFDSVVGQAIGSRLVTRLKIILYLYTVTNIDFCLGCRRSTRLRPCEPLGLRPRLRE